MPWTTWQSHERNAHIEFKTKPSIDDLEKWLTRQFGRNPGQQKEMVGFSDCILAGWESFEKLDEPQQKS